MSHDPSLTDWQRAKILEVILLGCDRVTACNYVNATLEELQAEIEHDEAFGREVACHEAKAETRHGT